MFIYNGEYLIIKGGSMGRDNEAEIISLVKDLQKRMTYLEKKIDILVQQSSEKSQNVKSYSQKSQTYGGAQRFNDKQDKRFGSKNERYGRSFKNKQNNENRDNSKGGKFFNSISKGAGKSRYGTDARK